MLEKKKRALLEDLEQIQLRARQLEQELAQRRTQEQQVIGALLLLDELLQVGSEVVPEVKKGEES